MKYLGPWINIGISDCHCLCFEVAVVVVSTPRIEHRAAAWALAGRFQVLPDGQLHSACPAQHGGLIPLPLWPDFNLMAGQRLMAVLTRKVSTAALHFDRDHIHRSVAMGAAGLGIKSDALPGVGDLTYLFV